MDPVSSRQQACAGRAFGNQFTDSSGGNQVHSQAQDLSLALTVMFGSKPSHEFALSEPVVKHRHACSASKIANKKWCHVEEEALPPSLVLKIRA